MGIDKLKNDGVIYCRRCGRKLNGIKSRELGFGKKCYELWIAEQNESQPNLFSKGGDGKNDR